MGKSHLVTFHYYMGLYYGCYQMDIIKGINHLDIAFNQCSKRFPLQLCQILKLLIPMRLLNQGEIINLKQISTLELNLPEYIIKLIKIIFSGDIETYETLMSSDMLLISRLLKDDTYILWQQLLHRVQLQRVKQIWSANEQKSIIPLSTINVNDTLTESQMSLLIHLGYIKGYLSHGHQVVVLSKTDPFPK